MINSCNHLSYHSWFFVMLSMKKIMLAKSTIILKFLNIIYLGKNNAKATAITLRAAEYLINQINTTFSKTLDAGNKLITVLHTVLENHC